MFDSRGILKGEFKCLSLLKGEFVVFLMVRNCFGLKIISVLWQITCKDKSLLLFSKSRTEAMTWFRSIRDAIRWGAKITIALPRGPNPHWKWTCKNYALLIGWKRVYFHVTRVQSCSTRANFKERAHAFKMLSVLTFLRARAILLSLKNLLVRIYTKLHSKSCYYLY